MSAPIRFHDENLRGSDFRKEVWVVCPSCGKKAIINYESEVPRLICVHCGLIKDSDWNVDLWLVAPFKNNFFVAYNGEHLEYLERYIRATLREHKDRTHFTLLEKLPKFYHEAKNREGLLKVIAKLKTKE